MARTPRPPTQDLLLYVVQGIGQYAKRARAGGAPDDAATEYALFAVFTTLTNVNFTTTRFVLMIDEAARVRDRVRSAYEAAAGDDAEWLSGPAVLVPASDTDGLLLQAATVGVAADRKQVGDDIIGLRALNLYGLKGVCAYAHHAAALGRVSTDVLAQVEDALDYLASGPTDAASLLDHALALGRLNLGVMALLDAANTGAFGTPVPTPVRTTPTAGKAVLVSGHDSR